MVMYIHVEYILYLYIKNLILDINNVEYINTFQEKHFEYLERCKTNSGIVGVGSGGYRTMRPSANEQLIITKPVMKHYLIPEMTENRSQNGTPISSYYSIAPNSLL